MLEVLTPGLLSTVQDAGRHGYADLGLPRSGACDPWGLAAANALLGNELGAPALEMTVVGPELRVLATCVVAVAGSDLGAHIPEEHRAVRLGESTLVRAGTTLAFAPEWTASHPAAINGARAYLTMSGGIDVPAILGSAATYLAGGFGGLEGRALASGDRLRSSRRGDLAAAGRRWPDEVSPPPYASAPVVRIVRARISEGAEHHWAALLGTEWKVAADSDRMGLRLSGTTPMPPPTATSDRLLSHGVTWGTVQLPPGGQPIILLADHQTVGGYPVLGVVAAVDRPLLGQLAPGGTLHFAEITIVDAQTAYREQMAALRRAAAALLRRDPWEQLPDASASW